MSADNDDLDKAFEALQAPTPAPRPIPVPVRKKPRWEQDPRVGIAIEYLISRGFTAADYAEAETALRKVPK